MAKKLTKAQINDINLQYLPRLTVKNADEYLQKSAEGSVRVRKKLACRIDVPYGDTPGQMLDIFPAARKGAPVHVFIHGGYWRALDKDIYSHLAGPMVVAGATVVLPNYDLCPKVRITDIVHQMRRAIALIRCNLRRAAIGQQKIYPCRRSQFLQCRRRGPPDGPLGDRHNFDTIKC